LCTQVELELQKHCIVITQGSPELYSGTGKFSDPTILHACMPAVRTAIQQNKKNMRVFTSTERKLLSHSKATFTKLFINRFYNNHDFGVQLIRGVLYVQKGSCSQSNSPSTSYTKIVPWPYCFRQNGRNTCCTVLHIQS
jgi:hypothetical protein